MSQVFPLRPEADAAHPGRRSWIDVPQRPLALWAGAVAAGFAADAVVHGASRPVCVAGALAAVALLRGDTLRQIPAAAAMTPIWFLGDTPGWGWALAALLAALAGHRGGELELARPDDGRLTRHLSRCRRRGESADLLVALLPASDAHLPDRLRNAFRVTDTVELERRRRRLELRAAVDTANFERQALERRIAASAGAPLSFGWARFPDDGVTVDLLVERARARAARGGSPVPPARRGAHPGDSVGGGSVAIGGGS